MRFNIISNLTNKAGLQLTYEILREELERRGHQVRGIQFNAARDITQAHVNIFIETVRPELFRFAQEQWVIPMPEWWDVQWFNLKFDRILALTHDCHRIFSEKYGDRCQYLGWTSRNLYDGKVHREARFLHVAGKSPYKNTLAVIDGCRLAKLSVTIVDARHRVSDAELKRLMNLHRFHVMPSAYEGYGYTLHEALSVGAVLITTNAPPMNEISPAILVPVARTKLCHATTLHEVSPVGVMAAVTTAFRLTEQELEQYHDQARTRFMQDEIEFHINLDRLLHTVGVTYA